MFVAQSGIFSLCLTSPVYGMTIIGAYIKGYDCNYRVGPHVGEPIYDMDVWPSPVILV
jgi:hypothetical protein